MASRRYPTVECATIECTTIFTKTGNRQKYCPDCSADRNRAAYKAWYHEHGGAEYLKKNYFYDPEVAAEYTRRYYYERGGKEKAKLRAAIPEVQLARRKRDAARVQALRERRVIEMLEGGRIFRLRNAPVSGPHLTDIADYQAGTTKFERVEHPQKPVKLVVDDEYAWNGSFRGRMNR